MWNINNMKIENVLSLFDGMSGAQQALNRAGICFENYYSCEIDKFCNQVVSANFPKTVQLGDVTKVTSENLPKIDLLVCGSPCQGFSFAGKMLNFSDPRSALFFEAVRILNECRVKNPNILFLFENVRMKLEYELVFTKYLGVEPILINSALLSAQNRNRLYWTNIAAIPSNLFGDLKTQIKQPKDKGLFLKDILEIEVDKKYYLSERMLSVFDKRKGTTYDTFNPVAKDSESKSRTINARMGKMGTGDNYVKIDKNENPKENQDKASCFTAGGNSGGNHSDMDLVCVRLVNRPLDENWIRKDGIGLKNTPVIEFNDNNKSNCITLQEKDNYIIQRPRGFNTGGTFSEKSPPITCNSWEQNNTLAIRRLTPREVCRLQTVDYDSIFVHNCKQIVSDTQVYKMNGNGFTIDVISYIFSHILINTKWQI